MIELRWLVRGGEKILQYRQRKTIEGFSVIFAGWSDWQDIPEVREDEHDCDKYACRHPSHSVQKHPDSFYTELEKKFEKLYDEMTEIALYSTTRPREMGEGDDGDGHFKRIAYALINRAAIARRMVR